MPRTGKSTEAASRSELAWGWWGWRNWGRAPKGQGVSFWDDEHVPKLTVVMDVLKIPKATKVYTLNG